MNKPEPTVELLQLIVFPQKNVGSKATQATSQTLELVPAMKRFRIDQLYLYAFGKGEMELKPINFTLATQVTQS